MQGKTTRLMAAPELARRLAGYRHVLVDLGTGDGRFVLDAARRDPALFAVGVDACRENLQEAARRSEDRKAGGNTLFVIASAQALPAELHGLAARLTINFPWGSLRDSLLAGDPALLAGLRALARPGARIEVRMNASALSEIGWDLQPAGERACAALADAGFHPRPPRLLDAGALRDLPTTWARKLAYSRRPEAVYAWAVRREG